MDGIEIESPMQEHESTDESIQSNPKTTDREPTRTQSRDFAPIHASKTTASSDYDARRWPLWKRIYHTTAVAVLAFAVTLASSTVTPAILEIQDHFRTSREVATLSLSLYVLGLALGPMLAAPVSELFGRVVVYRTTGLLFILFLVGAGFSKSLGSLLVCRLFAGLASGPVLAVGAGTNADLWPPQHRALAVVSYVMMPFLGPSLGPVIGGFAAYYKGWRWTQWCATFVAVLAYALVLPMHETYLKIILQRQYKAKGSSSGENSFAILRKSAKVMILRPFHMLVVEPIVIFLSLYSAYTVSLLYAFFAAYPYTFAKVYGFNAWQSGLAFLGITLGVLLAVVTAISIDRFVYYKKFLGALREGKAALPPENRLYAAILGSVGAPIGLFWFAWTARPSVHWISPILAGVPFAWSVLNIFVSASMYLVDVYGPLQGASAAAANGFLRYVLGAVFPLFTIQMYETLGIAWATSLLGFISLIMMPIPWVFFKYGPSIRSKSRYNVSQF